MKHPDPVTEQLLNESPEARAMFDVRAPRTAWIASVVNARAEKQWTQTDLANAIGVKQPTIAKLESGERDPKLSTMVAVCRALEISELRVPIMPKSA